ncbi:MAG: helix-turn-helix domain-containing protein [Propionibacteriaceae bacterium]|jgi:predicted ArsR family transcriptional regulator|nr:helix-turn-helix domain-containing protein [Propionibacteriaceae bacterium]
MPAHSSPRIYDGTTGGSGHNGRRTHIIQLLRDAKEPLSVADVATTVGIHPNTARFHLESLVDAGLAARETEVSSQPGRRRILYTGTLPNQTHERAQGYRLLAQILTGFIAAKHPDEGEEMYEVGMQWGGYLTSRPAPFEVLDEAEIDQRVMDKLDALWFAPEFCGDPEPHLLLHNCPFSELARSAPDVVCRLHLGMINGSLAELRSTQRVVELCPLVAPHLCEARLGPAEAIEHTTVPLVLSHIETTSADPEDQAPTA